MFQHGSLLLGKGQKNLRQFFLRIKSIFLGLESEWLIWSDLKIIEM